jgi:hypothetical protein
VCGAWAAVGGGVSKRQMTMTLTQTQQARYERTAYVALDAIDRLVGYGLGGEKTERALSAIRELITDIQNSSPPPARRGRSRKTRGDLRERSNHNQ